jgi:transposase
MGRWKARSTGAKMLKRQMYGRANLDLLNRRFLLAA